MKIPKPSEPYEKKKVEINQQLNIEDLTQKDRYSLNASGYSGFGEYTPKDNLQLFNI